MDFSVYIHDVYTYFITHDAVLKSAKDIFGGQVFRKTFYSPFQTVSNCTWQFGTFQGLCSKYGHQRLVGVAVYSWSVKVDK